MNITMEELRELFTASQMVTQKKENLGQNIAVLDRGFVYVGDVIRDGGWLLISNARNVRVWGTKNGLGELRNGPLPDTKLDFADSVRVPFHALQHLIPCKGF